ncbi:MAG: hypothetical protein HRU38_06820 [Saccharospirillaceae bacterium]|nr:hypothetical protein [Saccharospirillaceae bacterium]
MSETTSSRLSRLTLKKNDPFYELIMNEYNSHDSKQPLIREALIYNSIIKNKLPLLKLYLDKQIATHKVDTIDEERFYHWLKLMRQADEILDGHGGAFLSFGKEVATENVQVKQEPIQVEPESAQVKSEPVKSQIASEPERAQINTDKVEVVKKLGRESFSAMVANANK